MTRTTQAVRAFLLAAALLAAGPLPAHAAPHARTSGNWLHLTLTRGDARSVETRGALLLCDPPQGHARAAEACAQLRAADGRVERIPPRPGFLCPMIYAPVTASAQGLWDGRPTAYRHTFANPCLLGAETGAVFALAG